jgi:hypothetical protein
MSWRNTYAIGSKTVEVMHAWNSHFDRRQKDCGFVDYVEAMLRTSGDASPLLLHYEPA